MSVILALKLFQEKYPYPRCMDIEEAANPQKARRFWSHMAANGYVKITNSARCGFECTQGEFVTITKKGLDLLSATAQEALK